MISLVLAASTVAVLRGDEPGAGVPPLPPAVRESLDGITADSLRGHLSFLASDLLEGRGIPSRGLDLAAEYIAAQFRRAGLEPIGDDGYFRTASWSDLAPDPDSFACEFALEGRAVRLAADHASGSLAGALDLRPTPAIKIAATEEALKSIEPAQVSGKVVLTEFPRPGGADRARMIEADRARAAFLRRMDEWKPAAVVDVDRRGDGGTGLRRELSGRRSARTADVVPRIALHSAALARAFDAMPAGPSTATLSLRGGEPKEHTTKVRNVVGLLRGSDPAQKETYVPLSAHYDHLGIGGDNGSGDRIYNGANDDGSGSVSVIEIASALATLKPRPRRSPVFLKFCGEERGLLGSRYDVEPPTVPLEKTVAAINLEQLGRTDDSDGARVSAATVTGYDDPDVGSILHRAGRAVDVAVVKHPTRSDAYFGASDNAPFAGAGIPAHTISVAYMFPDYHGADDEWEKIGFANMARVVRMAALGLLQIADGPAPAWNADQPLAAHYRKKSAGGGGQQAADTVGHASSPCSMPWHDRGRASPRRAVHRNRATVREGEPPVEPCCAADPARTSPSRRTGAGTR